MFGSIQWCGKAFSMQTPSPEFQAKAIQQVKDTFTFYNQLLTWYRVTWLQLFRSIYIFETERKGKGKSTVFWPLLYRETQKVADRLTTNNPKFVVTLNIPINPDAPEADMQAYEQVNQKALNYFWKLGNCQAKLRSWAKMGVDYGVSFAQVDFKRKTRKKKSVELITKENGDQVEKIVESEELIMEYPTFDVPDIFDIYFDPRIEYVDDMPAIILNKDDVRKSDILSNKEIYFNLDQIKDLVSPAYSSDGDNSKVNKFNQEGIPTITESQNGDSLNLQEYYGVFSETGEAADEEMWHFTVINGQVLVRAERINFLPFEKFVPTDVPAQGVGKGIAEPIKQLQDAYNLVRNQRFENINLVINRMWKFKQGAGIDPRKLQSFAGNAIPLKDMDGLQPLETPDVTTSSFSEAQSLNTEIQSINSTIDATQDNSAGGFTNLATGQKIRYAEYKSRFGNIRNNLEEALSRLGMKMLMMTSERAQQNPILKDAVTEQFYHVAKDAFDSISDFYSVSVTANSTANDSLENQRDEALTKWQLLVQAKAQGLPVDLQAQFKELMETFPGTNLNALFSAAPQAPQQGSPSSIPQAQIDAAQVQPTADEALTESLTQK
jgi:hypothetical protein